MCFVGCFGFFGFFWLVAFEHLDHFFLDVLQFIESQLGIRYYECLSRFAVLVNPGYKAVSYLYVLLL